MRISLSRTGHRIPTRIRGEARKEKPMAHEDMAAQPPTAGAAGATRGGPANFAAGRQATRRLADYAVAVRFEDLPPAVIQRAKDCITDTVGAIIYGADLPWSKMIIAYARANGTRGNSFIL